MSNYYVRVWYWVPIPLVERLKEAHPALKSISFDRGFHSPENARRIAELLPA